MKNNFVSAPFQLSADIADAATWAIPYPAGYNVGDFENAYGHYISLNGTKLVQPADLGLSFGATSVTVTNRTGGTLPALTKGVMQFELSSNIANDKAFSNRLKVQSVHAGDIQALLIDLGAPATASANAVALSQSVTFATTPLAVLNGALLSNGAAVFDVPRNVVAAWTGAAVLTITGTDEYGETLVEASASGTSLTGKKAFKTVTSASFSANVTAATIGTGDVLGLPIRITDQMQIIAELTDGAFGPSRPATVTRVPFQLTEAEVDAGGSFYVYPGFAGKVLGGGLVVENTVTTGGTISLKIATVAVAGFGLIVADGATAGTVASDYVLTNDGTEVFTAAQPLEIVVPAAFNASAPTNGHIDVLRNIDGTLVTALARDTKSTATTADVRGTYDPSPACNGAISFQMIVLVPEIDLGSLQFGG